MSCRVSGSCINRWIQGTPLCWDLDLAIALSCLERISCKRDQSLRWPSCPDASRSPVRLCDQKQAARVAVSNAPKRARIQNSRHKLCGICCRINGRHGLWHSTPQGHRALTVQAERHFSGLLGSMALPSVAITRSFGNCQRESTRKTTSIRTMKKDLCHPTLRAWPLSQGNPTILEKGLASRALELRGHLLRAHTQQPWPGIATSRCP